MMNKTEAMIKSYRSRKGGNAEKKSGFLEEEVVEEEKVEGAEDFRAV